MWGSSQPGKDDRKLALVFQALRAQGPYEGTDVFDSHLLRSQARAVLCGSDADTLRTTPSPRDYVYVTERDRAKMKEDTLT